MITTFIPTWTNKERLLFFKWDEAMLLIDYFIYINYYLEAKLNANTFARERILQHFSYLFYELFEKKGMLETI